MVLWEITLTTAYFLGLRRTYRLALQIQRRLLRRRPPTREFVKGRTRAIFRMALHAVQEIQRRDLEAGRSWGNSILKFLDRLNPQAHIRGEHPPSLPAPPPSAAPPYNTNSAHSLSSSQHVASPSSSPPSSSTRLESSQSKSAVSSSHTTSLLSKNASTNRAVSLPWASSSSAAGGSSNETSEVQAGAQEAKSQRNGQEERVWSSINGGNGMARGSTKEPIGSSLAESSTHSSTSYTSKILGRSCSDTPPASPPASDRPKGNLSFARLPMHQHSSASLQASRFSTHSGDARWTLGNPVQVWRDVAARSSSPAVSSSAVSAWAFSFEGRKGVDSHMTSHGWSVFPTIARSAQVARVKKG
eukprot:TRINITY_DN20964_c0_g1_i1.p1 TRINITY_DN20964_c0_g1~~TRINITY_DN20964_c0_g1_i1.p1  ORF type:complete len:358 (+),score=44.71 TRINITY_DN20964_c0_g1_i1:66-1139(+)